MIPRTQIAAMVAEMGKIAGVERVEDFKSLRRKLRPGDIIVASMQPEGDALKGRGLLARAGVGLFRRASTAVQGDFTHSAIYAGNGKMVEIRAGEGTTVKPLDKGLAQLDAMIVRPNVSDTTRQRAVEKMKKYVGNADYDMPGLGRAVLADFMKLSPKQQKAPDRFICSNIITSAYGRVKFHKDKPADALMPKDFLSSHKVTPVTHFVNPNRTDRPEETP